MPIARPHRDLGCAVLELRRRLCASRHADPSSRAERWRGGRSLTSRRRRRGPALPRGVTPCRTPRESYMIAARTPMSSCCIDDRRASASTAIPEASLHVLGIDERRQVWPAKRHSEKLASECRRSRTAGVVSRASNSTSMSTSLSGPEVSRAAREPKTGDAADAVARPAAVAANLLGPIVSRSSVSHVVTRLCAEAPLESCS